MGYYTGPVKESLYNMVVKTKEEFKNDINITILEHDDGTFTAGHVDGVFRFSDRFNDFCGKEVLLVKRKNYYRPANLGFEANTIKFEMWMLKTIDKAKAQALLNELI